MTKEGDVYRRVHGEDNRVGSWMFRETGDVLSAEEYLRVKALPELPGYIETVTPAPGTRHSGRAAPNFGQTGGGDQTQILDPLQEYWFGPSISLTPDQREPTEEPSD